MCGKLLKAMYGTRDATQNWQRNCSQTVRELGFVTGRVSPCHSYQREWNVCGAIHRGGSMFTRDFEVAGATLFSRVKRVRRHAWRTVPSTWQGSSKSRSPWRAREMRGPRRMTARQDEQTLRPVPGKLLWTDTVKNTQNTQRDGGVNEHGSMSKRGIVEGTLSQASAGQIHAGRGRRVNAHP